MNLKPVVVLLLLLTKHRNTATLRSKRDSHFERRRLRGLSGCKVAVEHRGTDGS